MICKVWPGHTGTVTPAANGKTQALDPDDLWDFNLIRDSCSRSAFLQHVRDLLISWHFNQHSLQSKDLLWETKK